MSRINEIVASVKSFASTPAGKVALCGLENMLSMAICGGIVAKFRPAKATFGRALAAGIYAVAMQTIVGVAAANQERRSAECAIENRKIAERSESKLYWKIKEMEGRLAEARGMLNEKECGDDPELDEKVEEYDAYLKELKRRAVGHAKERETSAHGKDEL